MSPVNTFLLCDFYKISHKNLYPAGTQKIYSTWTPRASRIKGVDKVVAFGFQGFIKKYLMEYFDTNFFGRKKDDVVAEYKRIIKATLGVASPDTAHIEKLHDLGYLPLQIKAVKEGTLVPIRVPMLTIENTHADFFWLTNFIETLMSTELWGPSTSATIANQYRSILDMYAKETSSLDGFTQFQGHDFSMRGMNSLEAGMLSGAGHLLSFVGTDTIPAICYAESYYGANVEKELVGCSVPATEHSIMSAYGSDEVAAYKRIINEVHPIGIVSVVSDTTDFWGVVTKVLPACKSDIMARDGKLVIRPDSGDPVKIMIGDPDGASEAERMGLVETLWGIFGGTTNAKGFKELDAHIGCIYGDAITLDRCEAICAGLKAKGFASTNAVYGIGSYTYNYNTRDTFGFALKSTYAVINGDEKQIFKSPKTDDGTKVSQKGRVAVVMDTGVLTYKDGLLSGDVVEGDMLGVVYKDGKLVREQSFGEIRELLASQRG
jgi:nicotinamide phosphoribosyltransferase